MQDLLLVLLQALNETLTAAIVIVATSMLLYNLSRNLRNRVARTSGIVLACVTISYIGDVFIALGPGPGTYADMLRFQWIGIAFIPAALLHLSDALLATTGLPSRGRRRRVIRMLYLVSTVFLIAAAFTDSLIIPVRRGQVVNLQPGSLFWLYTLYFVLVTVIAVINVERARQRCLTRSTKRRMGYLLVAMLTPALGIFPYSVLLGIGDDFSLPALLLVNAGNLVVILMLLFLAYPLSFFGSRVPDRVVKAELLSFMLRGPATGLLALAVMIFTTPATRILSLPGSRLLPFAVVTIVLTWQWLIALILPWLEKRLIYFDEDDDQLAKLQKLSDRLLTRSDLLQLIEAILESTCDYLRVSTAFVIFLGDDGPEVIKAIGPHDLIDNILEHEANALVNLLQSEGDNNELPIHRWHSYWIMPLHSGRISDQDEQPLLIGLLGIEAGSETFDLTSHEMHTLQVAVRRATQTLDDVLLHTEIYAALEGLLPQYSMTRARAAEVEYRKGRGPIASSDLPDRDLLIEQVRAALRHYWGGGGLTHSRLQDLSIVRRAMEENDNNSTRALRAILLEAIEKQKPEGPRKMASPEWTIYNILQLRFIEKIKVRDVADRLILSEPDLYRKQRVAIEVVADTIMDMERESLEDGQESAPPVTPVTREALS